MKKATVIQNKKFYERLSNDVENNLIVYVYSYFGLGKTTFVKDFLHCNAIQNLYFSLKDTPVDEICIAARKHQGYILVIDNSEQSISSETAKKLIELISSRKKSTIVIGRARICPWLSSFLIAGNLHSYNEKDLTLSYEDFQLFCREENENISENDALALFKSSEGWAVFVLLLWRRYKTLGKYDESDRTITKNEVYSYFDIELFANYTEEMKRLLFRMACFTSFSLGLARAVCGESAEEILTSILTSNSCIRINNKNEYEIITFFRVYLISRRKSYLSRDDILQIYTLAGEYCYEKDNLPSALEYFTKAENSLRMAECLTENSRKHPGIGFYYEVEKYYLALPEPFCEQSPELMSALSMLHSLCFRVDESEYWFSKLEGYLAAQKRGSDEYKKAEESIYYLKIALPHRGIAGIKDILLAAAKLGTGSNIKFRSFSITGNMPSIMNGGLDFSDWSKNDRLLYRTVKLPAEIVLGTHALGFADISLGESLYEKSTTEELSEPVSWLTSGLSDVKSRGDIQLTFAGTGVMSRLFAAQGHMNIAKTIMNNCYEEASVRDARLLPNIRAFLILQQMMCGQTADEKFWLKNNFPDETRPFHCLDRFLYLVKARVYIHCAMYDTAISLLQLLRSYFIRYQRPYGKMQADLLIAIAMKRRGYAGYEKYAASAVAFCEKYSFIRPIADEGAPALDVLSSVTLKCDARFKRKLMTELKKQAVLYPNYLKSDCEATAELTGTEKNVLSLLVNGLTNAEIADMLFISVNTVKYHCSNIYGKLGVKNRTSACNWAKLNMF